MRNTEFALIKSFIFVMISFLLISCCFGDSIETDSYYVMVISKVAGMLFMMMQKMEI